MTNWKMHLVFTGHGPFKLYRIRSSSTPSFCFWNELLWVESIRIIVVSHGIPNNPGFTTIGRFRLIGWRSADDRLFAVNRSVTVNVDYPSMMVGSGSSQLLRKTSNLVKFPWRKVCNNSICYVRLPSQFKLVQLFLSTVRNNNSYCISTPNRYFFV